MRAWRTRHRSRPARTRVPTIVAAIVIGALAVGVGATVATTPTAAQTAPRYLSLDDAVRAGVVAPEVVAELRRFGRVSTILRIEESFNQEAIAIAASVSAQRAAAPAAPGVDVSRSAGEAPLPDRVTLNRELNTVRTEAIVAGGRGVRETRRFVAMPLSAVEVNSESGLLRLANAPQTGAVGLNERLTTELNQTLPFIGQPNAVTAGLAGAGTVVGVLDTGVDYTRAAFGSCTSPGVPAGCRVGWAEDFAPDDGQRDDPAIMHGTNVSGIVAGVAPGSTLAVGDVFSGGSAYTDDIIAGLEWLQGLKSSGVNVVAVNLSLGGSFRYTSNCADLFGFSTLLTFGIVPVVASGNGGFSSGVYADGIASPACIGGAVSVGRVYDANHGSLTWGSGSTQCTDSQTAADKVVCSSQSAPILSMLAPGSFVSAAGIQQSGTSQAAPHVAGAVAAVRGCRSELQVLPANDVLNVLTSTGTPVLDLRTGRTTPRLRMDTLQAFLAPTNDNRVNATRLSVPTAVSAKFCAASSEGGESTHAGVAAARSLWYHVSAFPPIGLAVSHPSGTRVAVYLGGTTTALPPEPCPIGHAAPCDAFTLGRGSFDIAVDADAAVANSQSLQFATYGVASNVRIVTPAAAAADTLNRPVALSSATASVTPRAAANSAP